MALEDYCVGNASVDGLHPELRERAEALLRDPRLEQRVYIISGVRTYAHQKWLYDEWCAGRYRVPVVANPDRVLANGRKGSLHMVQEDGYAYALDFDFMAGGDDWGLLEAVAGDYALVRTVPSEGWHYEADLTQQWGPEVETDWDALRRLVAEARTSVLAEGDTGLFVRLVQGRLGIAQDAIFGPQTRQAVTDFQAFLSIDDTPGVVGAPTWGALFPTEPPTAVPPAEPEPPVVVPDPVPEPAVVPEPVGGVDDEEVRRRVDAAKGTLLSQGSTGDAVALLQEALGIEADGIFGTITADAVRGYQQTHGLEVDGIVGPQTWGSLFP